MKKIIAFLLAMIMMLSFAACGGNEEPEDVEQSSEPEEIVVEPEEPEFVYENDYISVEGICVDNSYVDDEGSPLKMVYLFYTLNANDSNIEIDSKYTDLTINDSNTYESEHYSNEVSKYTSSYYYSSYIKDVYIGTSIKVIATFKIPEADIAPGRVMTISDSQIPVTDDIRMSTDEIKYCSGPQEIAQLMDPEGYADYEFRCAEADEETTKKVRKLINGYRWTFYVNYTTYQLDFIAPDTFVLRSSLGTKSEGTYTVRNGFVFCTYPDDGYTVEIPYYFNDDGSIKLDCVEGFDVMG